MNVFQAQGDGGGGRHREKEVPSFKFAIILQCCPSTTTTTTIKLPKILKILTKLIFQGPVQLQVLRCESLLQVRGREGRHANM